MEKFILIVAVLIMCASIQMALNPKRDSDEYICSMTYEQLRQTTFCYDAIFNEVKKNEDYKKLYSIVAERAKILWPFDYDKRQKEIQNYMHSFEENIFENYKKNIQEAKQTQSIP